MMTMTMARYWIYEEAVFMGVHLSWQQAFNGTRIEWSFGILGVPGWVEEFCFSNGVRSIVPNAHAHAQVHIVFSLARRIR